ncbi:hypothetical protein O9X80_23315 [Agrobacterium salinitolerans]|uniref:hypothetical protein n=1 Tax=Agrobacterium salinitolerans TaxID=1183413 RepID=UPI0022B84809|nr:hypothetical protein [Agrobacterium salinitolerans]MCZ7977434.1 hypothetical protein [Agrobacterium salinitolerans]
MKTLLLAIVAILSMLLGAWAAGLRVFVVQPSEFLPRQGTVIVYGMQDFSIIDSPEAICARSNTLSEGCKAGAAVGYLQAAKVIVALPYSETLHGLTMR